jgi:uncharacterized peroxidase-related enzyme
MFIEKIPEGGATGATADYYRQQRQSWGFLPNYAGAFGHRPDVAEAWSTLNLAIRNGMDRRRYELATIAAARALRSTYCTVAHSMFLRDVCGDETSLHRIAEAPAGETLDEQDRAVYRFAGKVATDAASIRQEDVDRLRAAGPPAASSPGCSTASARSLMCRPLRRSTPTSTPRWWSAVRPLRHSRPLWIARLLRTPSGAGARRGGCGARHR